MRSNSPESSSEIRNHTYKEVRLVRLEIVQRFKELSSGVKTVLELLSVSISNSGLPEEIFDAFLLRSESLDVDFYFLVTS